MAKIEIKNLSFFYPNQTKPAVSNVSLTIEEGSFFVLCGYSGCGKTTLLRCLKSSASPYGRKEGEIFIDGENIQEVTEKAQAEKLGFVQQSPENQIVTDKVWREMAFGLENMGISSDEIRVKVSETANFFGIQNWFYRDTYTLSGGQKQILNLASVMAMQPEILILDEPTAMLDPIAASEFLSLLTKINREMGTTIIITEQRLEEVLPLADTAAVMDKGKIISKGSVRDVGSALRDSGSAMFHAMPAPMRIWAAADGQGECPVTVKDGKKWLSDYAEKTQLIDILPEKRRIYPKEPVLEATEVFFRYEKKQADVVKNLTLSVKKGEFLAVLGGNATGKTTALKILAGLLTPQRGKVRAGGKVGMLFQQVQTMFMKKTVAEELFDVFPAGGLEIEKQREKVLEKVRLCRLENLMDRHPYDLSGGEQQRAALAKVLLTEPEILLLDEPTKGMDAQYKYIFGQCLESLAAGGTAIVMVSHDTEFCAQWAHRCALLFDGGITSTGAPRDFFSHLSFYTTAASRMARRLISGAVTAEEVIYSCTGKTPPPACGDDGSGGEKGGSTPEEDGVSFEKIGDSKMKKPERLSKSVVFAVLMILLLMPCTLFAGVRIFGGKRYLLTAILLLFEAMIPFFLVFEGKRPQPREIVIVAVLCALAVSGRAVFFMLPEFKPVMAITIISGAALGGETGFLVGAVTMLVSNMLFSQGIWTPWQMFSMGLCGFLAGVLFANGRVKSNKLPLCIFGVFCAVVIYGGIMNPASVIMWMQEFNVNMILTACAAGFPMDVIHGVSTAIFLWFISQPMLEKLERMKTKYGILA